MEDVILFLFFSSPFPFFAQCHPFNFSYPKRKWFNLTGAWTTRQAEDDGGWPGGHQESTKITMKKKKKVMEKQDYYGHSSTS